MQSEKLICLISCKLGITDRDIESLPRFCEDRNNVGNTVAYMGFVVILTKKYGNYYYSQYLNRVF